MFLVNIFQNVGVWLLAILPFLVQKVLVTLGIGLVSYVGFDVLITNLKDEVFSNIGGISGDLFAILDMIGVFSGITILFASMTTAVGIRAFLGATKKFASTPA